MLDLEVGVHRFLEVIIYKGLGFRVLGFRVIGQSTSRVWGMLHRADPEA